MLPKEYHWHYHSIEVFFFTDRYRTALLDSLEAKFKRSKRFCKCGKLFHLEGCPLSPVIYNERRWPGSDGYISWEENKFLSQLKKKPDWFKVAWKCNGDMREAVKDEEGESESPRDPDLISLVDYDGTDDDNGSIDIDNCNGVFEDEGSESDWRSDWTINSEMLLAHEV